MRGYTADEFRAVAEQVAGVSLKAFWDSPVSRHRRARLQEALETLGLRFRSVSVPADRPGPRVARHRHAQRRRPAAGDAGAPRHAGDGGRA
jgi:predicted metalloprotease with PDZ domain